jgi:hypothetical protein
MTGAASVAAAYEFTTTTIIPGVLFWHGAHIQILDMPGLVKGASQGRGRGKMVLAVARSSDLILFVLDHEHLEFRSLVKELDSAGIRVNKKPPNISVTKLERGGIQVESTVPLTRVNPKLVYDIAREFDIHNALIIFREDASIDDLIDVLAGNRVYIPAIYFVNKADLMDRTARKEAQEKLAGCRPLFVSASKGEAIEAAKDAVGEALAFIRIFMKPQGKEADMVEPLILRKGSQVKDMMKRLPVELSSQFKSAQVWGKSARFPGQTVGRDHVLQDQDIVTILVKRGAELERPGTKKEL